MAYSDKVLEHYTNPRNVGSMDKTSKDVGTGLVGATKAAELVMEVEDGFDKAKTRTKIAKIIKQLAKKIMNEGK